jgi:CDP-glycerol glycerophosphotransferase (TagB/SpsB family)
MLRRSDDDHLADLLYHSDVVVTSPSSIVLDAAVFGKPTILIGFDGTKPKPFWDSLRRYYDYEHQQAVIQEGNLNIAERPEEMVTLIRQYLNEPGSQKDNEKRIAERACYRLDGKSGERLADTILRLLELGIRN